MVECIVLAGNGRKGSGRRGEGVIRGRCRSCEIHFGLESAPSQGLTYLPNFLGFLIDTGCMMP